MKNNIFLHINTMKIHKKIRVIRQSKGYTQDYIANKLNLDTVNYGRIERGQSKLTVDRLIKLCEILEVSPKNFFDEKTDNSELLKLTEKIYEEIKQINKKIN
ncbi:MAG: helix-turn-helix transcriptional regulator [Bacteroidota bacterium]|nr:helix-turn-helix transcriptional regulator [Bacteroidota bacterium]